MAFRLRCLLLDTQTFWDRFPGIMAARTIGSKAQDILLHSQYSLTLVYTIQGVEADAHVIAIDTKDMPSYPRYSLGNNLRFVDIKEDLDAAMMTSSW